LNFTGSCHCAGIRYELQWPDTQASIPARRCTCSYCTRFNGTWTSHPDAQLTISCEGESPAGRYRFATGTAEFLFCGSCGVIVAALCADSEGLKAVLNINTLDEDERLLFEPGDSHFDGETLEQRLERRSAGWIGQVVLR
jgi:hypothetical protein